MKQSTTKGIVDMLHKIETIEKEVIDLKLSFLKKTHPYWGKGYISQGYSKRGRYFRERHNRRKKISLINSRSALTITCVE